MPRGERRFTFMPFKGSLSSPVCSFCIAFHQLLGSYVVTGTISPMWVESLASSFWCCDPLFCSSNLSEASLFTVPRASCTAHAWRIDLSILQSQDQRFHKALLPKLHSSPQGWLLLNIFSACL